MLLLPAALGLSELVLSSDEQTQLCRKAAAVQGWCKAVEPRVLQVGKGKLMTIPQR